MSAAAALTPVAAVAALGAPRVLAWALVLPAAWVYVRVARRLRVLTNEERARLIETLRGHGLARGLVWWMP